MRGTDGVPNKRRIAGGEVVGSRSGPYLFACARRVCPSALLPARFGSEMIACLRGVGENGDARFEAQHPANAVDSWIRHNGERRLLPRVEFTGARQKMNRRAVKIAYPAEIHKQRERSIPAGQVFPPADVDCSDQSRPMR